MLAAATAVAVVGGWSLRTFDRGSGDRAALPESDSIRLAKHRRTPGTQVEYAIAFSSDGRVDLGAFEPEGSRAKTTARIGATLAGQLVATILEDAPDETLILYRFPNPSVVVTLNERTLTRDSSRISDALEEGFLVHRAPDGRVEGIQIPTKASSSAKTFARAIAGWMVVALPSGLESSWTRQEKDRAGDLSASYATLPVAPSAAGLLGIRKSVWRAGVLGPGREGHGIGVVEIDFDLDQGVPRAVAGEESNEGTLGDKALSDGSSKFEANLASARAIPAWELEAMARSIEPLRAAKVMPLDQQDGTQREESRVAGLRARLGDTTLAQMVATLRAEDRAPEKPADPNLLFKLHASVVLHPEECEELGEILARTEPSALLARTIAGALSSAGSREAQHALVRTLRAFRGRRAGEELILLALLMLEHPTEEAEQAVRERRESSPIPEVASTAALALGNMAHALALEAPARADRIVEAELAHVAKDEKDWARLSVTLGALGNAGSRRAFAELGRLTSSASRFVRAEAVWALRRIAGDDVSQHQLALLTDDEVTVRERAMTSLFYRPLTDDVYAAVLARLAREGDASLRHVLLRLLWEMRATHPDVREVFRQQMRVDSNKENRELAEGYVEDLDIIGGARNVEAETAIR